MEIASAFQVTPSDGEKPGAYAVFPYDRDLVRRFREAFPRARWREVEHQYEALHREMLLTLEQRDEARKLLENERAERERLSKALQGQHR